MNHALSRMLDGLSKAEGELPEAVSYRIQSQVGSLRWKQKR